MNLFYYKNKKYITHHLIYGKQAAGKELDRYLEPYLAIRPR